MRADGQAIIDALAGVERERQQRLSTPQLFIRVNALKRYQQRRFRHTYTDLLKSIRYGPATRFFLAELYGPDDFTQRDAEFSRVVPALVRLFPKDMVKTVIALTELHEMSEILDTRMARNLDTSDITAIAYAKAWRATGCPVDRKRQIDLTLVVSDRLDGFTRSLLVRNSLRLMRRPAQAAGLGELQRFLESGFNTFKSMNGAVEFKALIREREQALGVQLFSAKENGLSLAIGEPNEISFLPPD
jgi:hypothetical protein